MIRSSVPSTVSNGSFVGIAMCARNVNKSHSAALEESALCPSSQSSRIQTTFHRKRPQKLPPVGSFSKTNPPISLSYFLHNTCVRSPLQKKSQKNGGFVS